MRRRCLWLLVILLQCSASAWAAAASEARPNVVLIISDDQGWNDFGFMGSEVVQTPHLDALAARSAVFPNGYVPTSLCRASLATLLTGLYGSQHKICCNDFPTDPSADRSGTHPFIKSVPTVPRLLRDEAGYLSLQTGKFWEGHYTNAGFTAGMTTKGRHGDDGLAIGRKTMQPLYDFIENANAQKKPFFVWYAPMMPHTPHNPPKRLLSKYSGKVESQPLAAYYAMCEWFDETVGQLLDFLEQSNLTENTLILFVIDNGWVQQPAAKGKFDVRSKRSPYDAGLRTPILIAWPGKVKPARHDDLVTSMDLSATILSACNVATPRTMQGKSLLDVAQAKGKLDRDAVFGEIYTHDALVLDKPVLSMTHKWARVGDLKLIRPEAGPTITNPAKAELYDLKADPHETKNLAAERPDEVKRLSGRIDDWWATIHPTPR